ncbi:uncharacterized protein LAJ45_05496 [Morchella importuna]|uniref:uncharacterized protein n=1 Tax=Morchella importuna TaxID=1174673 RepID=UPI001E8CABDF|nr:uncharacterized protein LAJ45_05496 [Morchella importuna]KAH8150285.1 hypothetical protein LAJ45_05496 [Morchella importuna]
MRFTSVLLLLISTFTFMAYATPIEVVGREAIPIPKTSPAITGDEALKSRAATYSFGTCVTITCDYGQCCQFTSFELLRKHLLSGYAVNVVGLFLYHDNICVGDSDRLWIDEDGYRDLYSFSDFNSMNMDEDRLDLIARSKRANPLNHLAGARHVTALKDFLEMCFSTSTWPSLGVLHCKFAVGVKPNLSTTSILAPNLISALSVLVSHHFAASCIGVLPSLPTIPTSAPSASNNRTNLPSPALAALCSAVSPRSSSRCVSLGIKDIHSGTSMNKHVNDSALVVSCGIMEWCKPLDVGEIKEGMHRDEKGDNHGKGSGVRLYAEPGENDGVCFRSLGQRG